MSGSLFSQLKLQDASGQEKDASTVLSGKVVGIYFSAHWCPPCRAFTPQLAQIYTETKAAGHPFEIIFASGDRDEKSFNSYLSTMPWLAIPYAEKKTAGMLRSAFQVAGIPTLVLLDESGNLITKNGRAAIRNGWPFQEVQRTPKTRAAPSTTATASASSATWVNGHSDLTSLVDLKHCECLNETDPGSVGRLYKDDSREVVSDADEQLLIRTAFSERVKLRHIGLQGYRDGRVPACIKIFTNKTSMDFGDTEGPADASFSLTPSDWKPADGSAEVRAIVDLNARAFRDVSDVTVFVENNVEDEEQSALTQLRFFGVPKAGFDMNNLKKSG
jgi:thiol-disulfide isomerase/thioredoxin